MDEEVDDRGHRRAGGGLVCRARRGIVFVAGVFVKAGIGAGAGPDADHGVSVIVEILGPVLGVRLPSSNVEWISISAEAGLYNVRAVNGIGVSAAVTVIWTMARPPPCWLNWTPLACVTSSLRT